MSDTPVLLSDGEVRQFIADGCLVLQPDVDKEVHAEIDAQLRQAVETEPPHGNNILPRIPSLYTVLECPRVHGALISLLGSDYLLHPHRAIHRSVPVDEPAAELDITAGGTPMGKGSTAASVWHQDAQSPLARARHHVPRFLIGFYFPHDTPLDMGPTRLQAGSYLWPGPQNEPMGVVVPDHVAAGTFMLVHFDMVHAGLSNRLKDDRYMLKFVFSRMSNPTGPTWENVSETWQTPETQSAYAFDAAWAHIWDWMRGDVSQPGPEGSLEDLHNSDLGVCVNAVYRKYKPEQLVESLRRKAGQDLHLRRLVAPHGGRQYIRDDITGYPRRWNERAIVMEPETYALCVQGVAAIDHLIALAELGDPWLNVNIAFVLGEIGVMNDAVAKLLKQLLASEHQQVVRQAIDAIGFIRSDATALIALLLECMKADKPLWQQKEVERGWVAQDQIRLNVMFACVALIDTQTDKSKLEELLVLGLSEAGYSAEVAVDGLKRLNTSTSIAAALDFAAKRSWDTDLLDRKISY